MTNPEEPRAKEVLRLLPSVDAVLQSETAARLVPEAGKGRLTGLVRTVLSDLRLRVLAEPSLSEGDERSVRLRLLETASSMTAEYWNESKGQRLQRVINATGVIVHTNLGRAPLSESARRAILEEAGRYCNLEYDLAAGTRGARGARAEGLICEATGAEAALIVNNCAAATMIVLKALAEGGEAVVSRGELVEIGGDFRVPDVMAQSGVRIREVGTTNRTRLSDYEDAAGPETRMYLKVHTSNFKVIGFTESPSIRELSDSAHERGLLLYEDAGSGAIVDLADHGLADEPLIQKSLEAGADVVTFSGDKLLGGMQAGIIVGRADVVSKVRRHPLYRALRVDKLIYAGIEATLESFLRGTHFKDVPVLRMMVTSKGELMSRSEGFAARIAERTGGLLRIGLKEGTFAVGGGSAPGAFPESILVTLSSTSLSPNRMESSLRRSKPPVIARIEDETLVLDLRTVFEDEEDELLDALASLVA